MSVNSFKFVSPGVFVNEVDNSQQPRQPDAVGPVIIGRSERGPAMVPVQVNSFAEFVETFGEPIAGAQADDAWRQGNRIGPTYGAFAAQAYLKNGSPITFVRLLGYQHESAQNTGKAGWEMPAAYALSVGAQGSANKLAAIIYTKNTAADSIEAPVNGGENVIVEDLIQLNIKTGTTGTPATAATGRIVLATNFTAAKLADATEKFTIVEAASHTAGDPAVTTIKNLEVTFDNTKTNHVIDTAPAAAATLAVGIQGVDDNDEVKLASRIAAALNMPGTIITASPMAGSIAITKDDAGLTASFITVAAGNAHLTTGETIFGILDSIDGAAAIPGANSATSNNVRFNFNQGSQNYIRKILNTNPTLTNAAITEEPSIYFLGASFDQSIPVNFTHYKVTKINADHRCRMDATPSQSPWVLSQYMGDAGELTTDITSTDLTKLFRLHSLYSGAWEQRNFKVSIMDIKAPSNEYVKYGTFSVVIRSSSDSDATPKVFERFSNLNLDPTSPRYIAAVIGDMKSEWRANEKRYVTVGEFENKSRYLRVEMAVDVNTGAANPDLLPFGYDIPSHAELDGLTAPTFKVRQDTISDVSLSSPQSAFFGVTTDQVGKHGRFDESYKDMVTPITDSETMADISSALFTMDWIRQDAQNENHAQYAAGSLNDDTSFNAGGYTGVLAAGYDRFTMPLFGGSDGLDITQVEPFNDTITGQADAVTSYAYNTISRAIDTVADPEVVECNLMAMPGYAAAGLTGKLISTCETRADALAIIDLENDYVPRGWNLETESSRLPKVSDAVSSLNLRGINSSYGCAFFPWVQVRDDINNRLTWMPPSVAALGTMASSTANSELWFAPAGFTRGGLSNGAAGLPVTQTRLRLSSKERDILYEANINPIAQFPAEGIVIFGQKTLHVTPSALDRINVRRLMIHVKKEISRMAATVLFDQNLETTWSRFTAQANPFLASIQTRFGLSEYKVVLDSTTTTPELVDRNIVYAKIFLKPARAIEFIAIDFVITNSGASFDD